MYWFLWPLKVLIRAMTKLYNGSILYIFIISCYKVLTSFYSDDSNFSLWSKPWYFITICNKDIKICFHFSCMYVNVRSCHLFVSYAKTILIQIKYTNTISFSSWASSDVSSSRDMPCYEVFRYSIFYDVLADWKQEKCFFFIYLTICL